VERPARSEPPRPGRDLEPGSRQHFHRWAGRSARGSDRELGRPSV